jgi:hypothetical protein
MPNHQPTTERLKTKQPKTTTNTPRFWTLKLLQAAHRQTKLQLEIPSMHNLQVLFFFLLVKHFSANRGQQPSIIKKQETIQVQTRTLFPL